MKASSAETVGRFPAVGLFRHSCFLIPPQDAATLALTEERLPDGTVLTRAHDARGRSSTLGLGPDYAVSYRYAALGRFSAVTAAVQLVSTVFDYAYVQGSDPLAGRASNGGTRFTRVFELTRDLIASVMNAWDGMPISTFAYNHTAAGRRDGRIDSGVTANVFGYSVKSDVTEAMIGRSESGGGDGFGGIVMKTFHFALIAMLSVGLTVQTALGEEAAVLPGGWVLLDESGKTQVQVIEDDGCRFIRVTTSVPRAIGYRFPVEYEWAKVQATMKLRVREIKSDKPAGGQFRGRQLGSDRQGVGLNPGGAAQRLSEVTDDWVDYPTTGRVSPREVYRTVIAGFEHAGGTFDLASEVHVEVINQRPPYQNRAPEHTVRGGLPNFVQKLTAGKQVRIAYLGGSITAQNGYRTQTLNWFRKQYPQARIDEIVAAIGGTGSDLGAFRVGADVIAHKPDLVFIEFAVNDATQPTQQIHRTMEGIVRKIRAADPLTDICFVYTVMDQHDFLNDLAMGQYPKSALAMEDVANHYGIPTIHMGIEAARLEREGKAYFRKSDSTAVRRQAMKDGIFYFASDGVHPFPDTGHVLYTRAVVRAMEHILPAGQAKPHDLPQPLDPDHWQDARMIPFGEAATLSDGWAVLPADHPFAEAHKNRFAKIWMGKPGGKAAFHVKGRAVATFELIGPSSGRVRVSVNGKASDPEDRFLEQGINETDGRLRHFPITYDLNPARVHTVTLEVVDYPLEEKQQISRRQRRASDAQAEQSSFAESNLYGGMLLLRGAVVNSR